MINIKNNNEIDHFSMSESEVIEELKKYGIDVVYKPVAIVPENLETYTGLGRKSFGSIDMDIYEALNKITNRMKIIGDPFSK